jgi:hypothetical protein
MSTPRPEVIVGEGYAVGHIDALGEGYGFRKVRKAAFPHFSRPICAPTWWGGFRSVGVGGRGDFEQVE